MTSAGSAIPEEPPEPADLVPRNIAVGARLGVAATIFVFFSPFFAYFYLRSLNSSGMWRPAGVHPPQGFGAAIVLLFVASSAVLALANARTARERPWRALVACSIGLGVAGAVVQVVEYTSLGFGPMSGGYASVFIAWTALTAVFALATMLSLEAELAYGLRSRDAPPSVVRPRLAALGFYWTSLTSLAVLMWVVLYLI